MKIRFIAVLLGFFTFLATPLMPMETDDSTTKSNGTHPTGIAAPIQTALWLYLLTDYSKVLSDMIEGLKPKEEADTTIVALEEAHRAAALLNAKDWKTIKSSIKNPKGKEKVTPEEITYQTALKIEEFLDIPLPIQDISTQELNAHLEFIYQAMTCILPNAIANCHITKFEKQKLFLANYIETKFMLFWKRHMSQKSVSIEAWINLMRVYMSLNIQEKNAGRSEKKFYTLSNLINIILKKNPEFIAGLNATENRPEWVEQFANHPIDSTDSLISNPKYVVFIGADSLEECKTRLTTAVKQYNGEEKEHWLQGWPSITFDLRKCPLADDELKKLVAEDFISSLHLNRNFGFSNFLFKRKNYEILITLSSIRDFSTPTAIPMISIKFDLSCFALEDSILCQELEHWHTIFARPIISVDLSNNYFTQLDLTQIKNKFPSITKVNLSENCFLNPPKGPSGMKILLNNPTSVDEQDEGVMSYHVVDDVQPPKDPLYTPFSTLHSLIRRTYNGTSSSLKPTIFSALFLGAYDGSMKRYAGTFSVGKTLKNIITAAPADVALGIATPTLLDLVGIDHWKNRLKGAIKRAPIAFLSYLTGNIAAQGMSHAISNSLPAFPLLGRWTVPTAVALGAGGFALYEYTREAQRIRAERLTI